MLRSGGCLAFTGHDREQVNQATHWRRESSNPEEGDQTYRELDFGDVIAETESGLICEFFWECWYCFSLLRWEYSVSFFDGLLVFEVPLLGYL